MLNEHLKLSTEDTLRIQTVDLNSFAHLDFWSKVDEIIEDYTKIHPMEMEIIVRQNKQIAEGQFHKHGAQQKGSNTELRHRLRMPADLMTLLSTFAPELFETKVNYHKFMKRYKGLCAYA